MKIPSAEDGRTEFKRTWTPTARKTMVAFANDAGGILYFGVADDGEVVGCDFDEVERSVMSFARNGVEPPMQGLIRIERVVVDGKTLAVAYVLPGTKVPYSFKGRVFTDEGVYIRMGGQTVAATMDEIFELIRRGDERPWEARVSPFSDLTFDSAKAIVVDAGVRFDENSWLGHGLLDENRAFTNLALLLSDQNPTVVRLNHYDAQGRFAYSETETGSILRQMILLRQKLNDANPARIDKTGNGQMRMESRPWPVVALREALTNSIAHRDYTSPVQSAVNIFANSISFLTPGGLPPKITLEEALRPGWSFCRNQRLAEFFNRLGWMEKVGSGFSDIFQAYGGYVQKPRIEHVGRSFEIELPRIMESVPTGDRATVILGLLAESPQGMTRAEIESRLGVSRSTVRNVLHALETSGKIVRDGDARRPIYRVVRQF